VRGSVFCADAASNDQRPSAGELVGDAEFVEQRLGLEIGDPDRRDLPVSDSPNVDDFDYCVGAGNSHVDRRGDASALSDNAVVAEAREVEHIGEVGQYFVSKKRRALMCAAPGKIIGRGYLEVWIQIPREGCKVAFREAQGASVNARLASEGSLAPLRPKACPRARRLTIDQPPPA
jgi:hypothetical protein